MKLKLSKDDPATQAKAKVADAREYFERAVLRSGFAADVGAASSKQDLIEQTRQEFNRLEQNAASGEGDLENIVDSARSLARMRAYLWPIEEAKQEAAGMLRGMEDWGVPRDVLNGFRPGVEAMGRSSDAEARAVLYQLYVDHNYWDGFIDSLFELRKKTVLIAGVVTAVSALLALWLLLNAHVLWGFTAAAASGSALSVMRRPPPIDVFKKIADFDAQALRRLISGVMGSLLALGLVHAGVVVIPLPHGTDVLSAFTTCAQGCWWSQASILVAMGMAFGFSERLLTSVGDALMPSQSKASTDHAGKGREDIGVT